MSIRASLLSFFLRHTIKKQMSSFQDHLKLREQAGAGIGKTPAQVDLEMVNANGVRAEWVRWQGQPGGSVILYLHGGGYVFGGLDSHRNLVCRIAKACVSEVLAVDYRLAPENVFPAAVEDALASYQWLIEQGTDPQQVTVAGDSAGGGLAMALLLKLKELSLPMPNAAVLLSPWADLTLSGGSMQSNADRDAMLSPASLQKFTNLYLADADPRSIFASPLFADLSDMPVTYVLVGSQEVLRDDAERLVENIRRSGGRAELAVWPGMPHVFPLLAPLLPEGARAIEDIGRFVRAQHQ